MTTDTQNNGKIRGSIKGSGEELTKIGEYAPALELIQYVQASSYTLGLLERLNNPQDRVNERDSHSPYFHLR
jgi:hypothetical protein